MAAGPVQVLLARRPSKQAMSAFGHVDVNAKGRKGLAKIVSDIAGSLTNRKEIEFHPEDRAATGEVLVGTLKGFDAWFQQKAPWSLERTVGEILKNGLPTTLGKQEIRDGNWSFYAVRAPVNGADVVIVRSKSPTWGLVGPKLITRLVGTELQPLVEPLIAFDHSADVVVVGEKVYVLSPLTAELLFVDAEAVKKRAPQTAATFDSKIAAKLSGPTLAAVQSVCSKNANIARRVERLIRAGSLAKVTAAEVRAALTDAGLGQGDFGTSGALEAGTDVHATVLIDIAADLYYQPRFEEGGRRVGAFRKVA